MLFFFSGFLRIPSSYSKFKQIFKLQKIGFFVLTKDVIYNLLNKWISIKKCIYACVCVCIYPLKNKENTHSRSNQVEDEECRKIRKKKNEWRKNLS